MTRVLKIVNEKGLHARASAKFVQLVEKYDAKVTVSRKGESAGGDFDHGPDDARGRHRHIDYGRGDRPQAQEVDRRARRAGVAGKFGEEE